jgi:hypothetical protein
MQVFNSISQFFRRIEVSSGSTMIPALPLGLSKKIDIAVKEGKACYKSYSIGARDKLSLAKYTKEVSQDFTYYAASVILDTVSNIIDRRRSNVLIISF